PEQTGSDNRGIDTRSDVYALGVIALWLLLPPGAFNRLAAERSTRAELHDWLVGSLRGTVREPALDGIPAELRWIVAHATEPDRDDRYPSAQALAEDVERFREGHAVAAVPPTTGYRLRKFARRHRGALAASAAIALALVAGLLAALYGLDRAEAEALKARKVADVLAGILGGVDPDRARDLDKTLLRLVLDEAASRARTDLAGQPDVLLEIEDVIGQSYAGLADSERALAFAKSAYERAQANGAPADQLARIGRHYVDAVVDSGDAERGAATGERVVEDARKALGPDAVETRIAEIGLGWALRERGRYKEAEALMATAAQSLSRQLGAEDEKARNARYYNAILLSDLGRFDEGQRELDALIAMSTRIDGAAHPKTLRIRNSLAVLFLEAERWADAERVLKDALPDYEKTFGAEHSATLGTIGNLGGALRQGGKLEESGPYYRKAADGFAAKLGDDHPRSIMTRHNYGNFQLQAGDAAASLETQKAVYARAVKTFGNEHPVVAEVLEGWGKAATALGNYDEAQVRLDESLAMKTRIYGADHHALDATKEALAALAKARGAATNPSP
ncbi:MAG TPA: tetratricopeptide repeat-containing protein kinase family protein, partial [Xanthomonadales bacterium]|nr:tetratricopeptide repeat-containing protein kinase family protein [Xanthomonadales bacterium]